VVPVLRSRNYVFVKSVSFGCELDCIYILKLNDVRTILRQGKSCGLEGRSLQRSRRDILRVGEEEHGNGNLQIITEGNQEAKG